jgi:TPR repeat protein
MQLIKTIIGSRILSTCTALAILSGAAQAHATSDLEQALDAQKNGNLSSAASYFSAASEAGSSEAQYQLGLLYAEGRGVEKNYAQAVVLIQQAADAGHSLAIEWIAQHRLVTATTEEEEEEEDDPEDDC